MDFKEKTPIEKMEEQRQELELEVKNKRRFFYVRIFLILIVGAVLFSFLNLLFKPILSALP